MDEVFFTCLGLGFGLFLLATAIAGWVALARAHRLEKELGALRMEVRKLERARPAQPSTSATGPAQAAKVAPLQSSAETAAELARERAPTAAAPPVRAPEPPRSPEVAAATPTPRREPKQPARERVKIDWERWLGVRGFAVVGGVLFALAAILLFQHAFTHNWIPPWARVAGGIGAGLAAIAWAARLRSKQFVWAPSALEGAGVVALYASLWAAQQRYALVGPGIAFPGMALVTALAGWLALRHGSLFSALLGLAGGFATPLLLAEGHERPVPLFGYVLLLDLGLLFVARKRSWTLLGLLALACTQLLLGAWIFARGGAAWPGLGFALAFAAVFALVSVQAPRAARGLALATQALGLLAPFLFALHYASAVDLGRHFGWTGTYLALLIVLATVVARRPDAGWLAGAAVIASVAVVGTWFVGLAPLERGDASGELVLAALLLTGLSHALGEWENRRGVRLDARAAALVASLAWSGLLFLVESFPSQAPFDFWFFLGGVAGLAALLLRQCVLLARGELAVLAGVSLGFALARLAVRNVGIDFTGPSPTWRAPVLVLLLLGGGAALLFLVPRLARTLTRGALHAAGALVVSLAWTSFLSGWPTGLFAEPQPWLPGLLALGLAAIVLEAARKLESRAWAVVTVMVTTVLTQGAAENVLNTSCLTFEPIGVTLLSIWLAPATVTLLGTAWAPGLARRQVPWAALAALGPLHLHLFQFLRLDVERRGFATVPEVVPYLVLAVPPAIAAFLLARRGAPAVPRAWLAGASLLSFALTFAALVGRSVPGNEYELRHVLSLRDWAMGLSLAACGWSALGRRYGLDLPRTLAAAAGLLSVLLLLGGAQEAGAYATQGPLAPWIAYEHLVPAAALFGALLCLPPTDRGLLQRARRAVLGTGVLLLVFLWLNWTIENLFTETERVTFFASKGHARDLTTSLAWGVYGMVLLLLGTWRHVTSLRWASLAVLLLSIGKVFLHDLGHLDGLYRVASLAGLALSLIGVSLFYQRFVFGKVGARASANPPVSPS